jgi:hypothetical protein
MITYKPPQTFYDLTPAKDMPDSAILAELKAIGEVLKDIRSTAYLIDEQATGRALNGKKTI